MSEPISSEEIAVAITEGVVSYLEMKEIRSQQILTAIEDGVQAAFWQMIMSATDMPGSDFYATVQAGVEKAMSQVTIKSD
jgi:hypothetical protein